MWLLQDSRQGGSLFFLVVSNQCFCPLVYRPNQLTVSHVYFPGWVWLAFGLCDWSRRPINVAPYSSSSPPINASTLSFIDPTNSPSFTSTSLGGYDLHLVYRNASSVLSVAHIFHVHYVSYVCTTAAGFPRAQSGQLHCLSTQGVCARPRKWIRTWLVPSRLCPRDPVISTFSFRFSDFSSWPSYWTRYRVLASLRARVVVLRALLIPSLFLSFHTSCTPAPSISSLCIKAETSTSLPVGLFAHWLTDQESVYTLTVRNSAMPGLFRITKWLLRWPRVRVYLYLSSFQIWALRRSIVSYPDAMSYCRTPASMETSASGVPISVIVWQFGLYCYF